MNYLEQAIGKLEGVKSVSGKKESVMMEPVREALLSFCRQDAEFAQAVAQGGSFEDCMKAVAQGVGSAISDIDAYKKAVQFYFEGAAIEVQMKIDLCPNRVGAEPETKVISLEDFL